MRTTAVWALLATLVTFVLVAAAATTPRTEQDIQLKDGPGRELTAARCTVCHSVDYIEMNASVMDRPGWERSVQKMIDRFGAPIDATEAQQIVEYLSIRYSKP